MDTYTHGPNRRVEDARASLLMRIDELGKRLREARHKLDIRAHIAAHPLAATGAAFAVGLLLGLRKPSKKVDEDAAKKAGMASAMVAAMGAIGLRLAKDLAMRKFSDSAWQWWQGASPNEARASHEPSVEAFLEH